jgi:hypothetical protein
MSTILDALRKAAERRPGASAEQSPAVQSPTEPTKDPPAVTAPAEPPTSRQPHQWPEAAEEAPPEDFSISEDPSFLPSEDDTAAKRATILRAAVVVAVGVVLGLLVGRSLLPESGMDEDDLLSDAALSKSAAKTPKPSVANVQQGPPAKTAGEPSSVSAPSPAETASEKAAGGEKPRGSRGEKQRRVAEKRDDANKAQKSPADQPRGETAPPFAAALQPQQAALAPETPPAPAADPGTEEAPGTKPPEASAVAPAGKPALPAAPPALATLPLSPPVVPTALPPLPDDAPALALLFVQWSSDPARRVASLRQVSGGAIYIVHEGETVQGLQIALIRPTGIEVQWRGQSFLLPASRH